MVKHAARLPVLAAAVLSCAAAATIARADAPAGDSSQSQSHATIRGSGKDVSIVYRGTAANTAPAHEGRAPDSNAVVAEAQRLAAKGAGDDAIIKYLLAHEAGLPTVVAADAARDLRKAGAGPSVIMELSRLTAIDIGPTAPDAAPAYAVYSQPGFRDSAELSANSGGGYPFYGGGGFFPRGHGRTFAHSSPQPQAMRMPGHVGGPGRPPTSFSAPRSEPRRLPLFRP